MSEAAKHRHLVVPYCIGMGVDLGSSGVPIVPWVIQMDLPLEQFAVYNPHRQGDHIHIRGDSRVLPFKDEVLDFVHSSHLLEDFEEWEPILQEWDRVLKMGGHMMIAVPDHARFRQAVRNGQGDNLNHRHEAHVGELSKRLKNYTTVFDGFVNGSPHEYSILYIGRKDRKWGEV